MKIALSFGTLPHCLCKDDGDSEDLRIVTGSLRVEIFPNDLALESQLDEAYRQFKDDVRRIVQMRIPDKLTEGEIQIPKSRNL